MEAVSRMERGIVVPTVVRLAELCSAVGCELADFLRETSNRPTEQGIVLSQQLARSMTPTGPCYWTRLERLVCRLAKVKSPISLRTKPVFMGDIAVR
ncbi:hypothetical protein [Aeromonas hydrophila]|uniref:hypothetical protein n=1 Tax=Aeromonas hydrophila TaxID=644 RepID=UPI003BF60F00